MSCNGAVLLVLRIQSHLCNATVLLSNSQPDGGQVIAVPSFLSAGIMLHEL